MATTGKEATVINGYNLYNKRSGLAIPVARKLKWTKLDSRRRMELQQKYQNVRIVFVDDMVQRFEIASANQNSRKRRQKKASFRPLNFVKYFMSQGYGATP